MELAVLAEPGVKKPPMPLFAVCDGVCSALGELRPTLEGWSWTESSFSIRSAKAFLVMSNGSKPRSSSCCLEEPNPKAACQSVDEDTGIVSDVKRLCGSGAVGQSCVDGDEVGYSRLLGRGLGCLKLLLSEKRDWDSAAAPSKGDRAL